MWTFITHSPTISCLLLHLLPISACVTEQSVFRPDLCVLLKIPWKGLGLWTIRAAGVFTGSCGCSVRPAVIWPSSHRCHFLLWSHTDSDIFRNVSRPSFEDLWFNKHSSVFNLITLINCRCTLSKVQQLGYNTSDSDINRYRYRLQCCPLVNFTLIYSLIDTKAPPPVENDFCCCSFCVSCK